MTQPTQPSSHEFQLLSCGPLADRTYAVGLFMVDGVLDLSNWQPPIHIARSGTDTKTRKLPLPDPSKPPQKRQEARKAIQKSRRGHPFHLEDASKKNLFNGHLELDQSNRFEPQQSNKYVIFKSEGGAFKVIPCDDWYSFKREPKNIPLPLEEAEKLLKEWVKGERASANTGEMAKASNIRDKMSQIKKEDREKKPSKDKFNATGEYNFHIPLHMPPHTCAALPPPALEPH